MTCCAVGLFWGLTCNKLFINERAEADALGIKSYNLWESALMS